MSKERNITTERSRWWMYVFNYSFYFCVVFESFHNTKVEGSTSRFPNAPYWCGATSAWKPVSVFSNSFTFIKVSGYPFKSLRGLPFFPSNVSSSASFSWRWHLGAGQMFSWQWEKVGFLLSFGSLLVSPGVPCPVWSVVSWLNELLKSTATETRDLSSLALTQCPHLPLEHLSTRVLAVSFIQLCLSWPPNCPQAHCFSAVPPIPHWVRTGAGGSFPSRDDP